MNIVKISSKGQITIPKNVREILNLKPGDRIEIKVKDNFAILEPLRKPSESMKGIGLRIKKKLGITAVELVHELRREDREEL